MLNQQKSSHWWYIRGGHLGQLVAARARPIQNGSQEPLAAYPSLRVQQVVSDMRGGLWVATGSAAVVAGRAQVVPPTPPSLLRYSNGQWQRIAVYTGSDGFVPAFCRDTTVWGLDPAGVATYHGATRVSLPHHLNAPLVRLMRDQEGHLWGLTLPGDIVYSRDAQQWTVIQTHVGRSRFLLIDTHRYQGVWIAPTTDGLFHPRSKAIWQINNQGVVVRTVPPLPRPRVVTCVFEDSMEQLWCGTEQTGIVLFDGQTWHHSLRVSHDTPVGLPARTISALLQDHRQRLWAMTPAGVAVFVEGMWRTIYVLVQADSTGLLTVWKEYSGLITTHIDPGGRLWMATEDGQIGWIDTTQPLEQLPSIPPAHLPQPIHLMEPEPN